MSLLGTKAGDAYLLGQATGVTTDSHWVVHLSTNARTPNYDDTPSNWTECTDSDYAAVNLLLSAASITPADPFSYIQWAPVDFTFATTVTITGYWISNPSNTVVIAAEEISPVWSYGSAGGPGVLTPTIGLQ